MPNKNRTGNTLYAWTRFQNRVIDSMDEQRRTFQPQPTPTREEMQSDPDCTCGRCLLNRTCALAWAAYNTDGDCIMK